MTVMSAILQTERNLSFTEFSENKKWRQHSISFIKKASVLIGTISFAHAKKIR